MEAVLWGSYTWKSNSARSLRLFLDQELNFNKVCWPMGATTIRHFFRLWEEELSKNSSATIKGSAYTQQRLNIVMEVSVRTTNIAYLILQFCKMRTNKRCGKARSIWNLLSRYNSLNMILKQWWIPIMCLLLHPLFMLIFWICTYGEHMVTLYQAGTNSGFSWWRRKSVDWA